jgi:hypothetical protein
LLRIKLFVLQQSYWLSAIVQRVSASKALGIVSYKQAPSAITWAKPRIQHILQGVRRLLSRHDGSTTADARLFRWFLKRIDDGRRQAQGAKLCSVEGECREVAGAEVGGLGVGRVGLDEAWIVDGSAEENDCVPYGMTLNLVAV